MNNNKKEFEINKTTMREITQHELENIAGGVVADSGSMPPPTSINHTHPI